jgi:hypothetical protein
MLAEYAALRACVLALWCGAPKEGTPQDFTDLVRFNAAIDRAMAQSMRTFTTELDRLREWVLGTVGHDLTRVGAWVGASVSCPSTCR